MSQRRCPPTRIRGLRKGPLLRTVDVLAPGVPITTDVVARALAVAEVPVVEFDLAEVLEQVQIW